MTTCYHLKSGTSDASYTKNNGCGYKKGGCVALYFLLELQPDTPNLHLNPTIHRQGTMKG